MSGAFTIALGAEVRAKESGTRGHVTARCEYAAPDYPPQYYVEYDDGECDWLIARDLEVIPS